MLIHVKLAPEEKGKLDFLRAYLRSVTPPGVMVSQTAVMRWALDVAFMAMLKQENPEEYERRSNAIQERYDALVPCDSGMQSGVDQETGADGE